MAFKEFTGELDAAPVATPPGGKFREFTGELDKAPLTEGEAIASSVPSRFLAGASGPAKVLMKLIGPDSIKQQMAAVDAMRQRGMEKQNTGFDWAGLLGSLVPGSRVAKVAEAVPALGKIGQGVVAGGATAAAQPIEGDELSRQKLKQVGLGAATGGAISTVAKGAKAFLGTNQLNPTQAATLKEGQAAGYTVPPSMVNPSGLNNTLESIAGKAAVKQDATARNQKITTAIAPEDIGLPQDTPLSEAVLEHVRQKAGESYNKMAQLYPGGELQRLRVRSKIAQDMEPGPVTGIRVTKDQLMEPGPVTGLKVRTIEGDPAVTGLKVGEVRDAEGRLIGLKVGKNSEGVDAPLEGLNVKVKSRGQDVPGQLEGMKTTVVSRGQDVPGPLKGMKVSVQETRGGNPIEDLKQLRADANAYYKHYARSADPESLRKAKLASGQARAIEEEFERRADAAGKPELVKDMKADRQKIAKTYDLEKALSLGDSNISAPALKRQLDTVGEKGMSGRMKTIAKMADAFGGVMGEGAKAPVAGVSGTDAGMAALLGAAGYFGSDHPGGAGLALLPFLARPAARNLVLSKGYQNTLAQGIPARYQPLIDALTQQAIGAGGTTAGRAY